MYSIDTMTSLNLGEQGEHLANEIRVDMSPWVDEDNTLRFYIVALRHAETNPYIPATTMEDNILVWPVTSADTGIAGAGLAQFVATDGTRIVKSKRIKTAVGDVIPGTDSDTPPDPASGWVERVINTVQTLTEAAQSAKADAESAAEHAESVTDGIDQAGAAQVEAVNAAGTAQVKAVQDKGDEVIDSIPEDYSTLTNEVTDLKSVLNNNAYSANLCGTTPEELYPVTLKQGDKVTVSTSDGSILPDGHGIKFRIYDANKTRIDYYSLTAGSNKRTIIMPADVYYVELTKSYSVPFMVARGDSAQPYVPYFPGVKKLKELVDKNATDITAINEGLDTLESTYFKWGRPYLTNNSLLNPTNITGGVYAFGPTNVNTDYPDDWDGTLYGEMFYFNTVDIIIRQANSGNIWIKGNNKWETIHNANSIVSQNDNKIPEIQQLIYGRPTFIGADHPMSFIHFSDIHARQNNWNRVCKFGNAYKDYFSFIIHTGDYVRNDQSNAVDLYSNGVASELPLLNVVGNHDIYSNFVNRTVAEQATTRGIVFPSDTSDWGVTFGSASDAMYYYKDFATEKVRLIVLDLYYNSSEQQTWLADVLAEAKTNGYHVITATHEVTKPITTWSDNTFCSRDAAALTATGLNVSSTPFDAIIKSFKDGGGVHIANICGHEHVDLMGKTVNGIMNIVISTSLGLDDTASDANRVEGTVTNDCINCIGVNTNAGILKIVRIGCDTDHYLRSRKTLCYDYINDQIIANA